MAESPELDVADGSKAAHSVAQILYHQENGTWGYDPGDVDESERYYEDALEVLHHALPHLPEFLAEVAARESHAEEATPGA